MRIMAAIFCLVSSLGFASANRSLFEIVSAHVVGDGQWVVSCSNGALETVSSADLGAGNVCLSDATANPSRMLSFQKRSDGKFDAICRDLTTRVVSPEQLYGSKICLISGEDFYGPVVSGEEYRNSAKDTLILTPVEVKKAGKIGAYGFVINDVNVDPYIRMAVYTDKAGRPDALVAQSGPLFFDTEKRYEYPGGGEQLSVGKYWLAWVVSEDTYLSANSSWKGQMLYAKFPFATEFPTTFNLELLAASNSAAVTYLLPAKE